jgi:hypothetical protein
VRFRCTLEHLRIWHWLAIAEQPASRCEDVAQCDRRLHRYFCRGSCLLPSIGQSLQLVQAARDGYEWSTPIELFLSKVSRHTSDLSACLAMMSLRQTTGRFQSRIAAAALRISSTSLLIFVGSPKLDGKICSNVTGNLHLEIRVRQNRSRNQRLHHGKIHQEETQNARRLGRAFRLF